MIKLLQKIFLLSRFQKKLIIIIIDTIICISSFLFSLIIITKSFYIQLSYDLLLMLLSSLSFIIFFVFCGFYNTIFRYINIKNFFVIALIMILYTSFNSSIYYISKIDLFSSSVVFLHSLFFMIAIFYFRLLIVFLANFEIVKNYKKNILIYGAGLAGISTLQALSSFKVLGFVDDDPNKQHTLLANIKVYPVNELSNIIKKFKIDTIFVTIPSITIGQKKTIINNLEKFKLRIRFLPTLKDFTSEKIDINDFVPITPEDLIERTVKWDKNKINEFYLNQIVCVTGAGGSIGSEISKQIILTKVSKLIIVDHSELNLFNVEKELQNIINLLKLDKIKIIKILGSILDNEIIENIFEHNPKYIFHAAAYKHVNMIENNPIIGVKNNIQGTINLVDQALKNRTNKFIFISTDKAVRPTSIMGYTKRIGEKYIEYISENSQTKFSIVRFGNVIGSSGSVFGLFKKQIEKRQPITITHKDVTRYFMSVQEAVGLVLEVSIMKNFKNITFLLNMGNPIKIKDLAIKMVNLSGLKIKDKNNINGDIEIKYIGLKQGEKLHEELNFEDNFEKTSHKDIFSIPSVNSNVNFVNELKILLENIIINNNKTNLNDILKKLCN